ncbi:hypothetical protein AVEN_71552-1 [Araneus ventricosus]|uniref:Uncharacterized protein n=1 Tax=Araneus ventricosus TaxID=182803 RepID=A0A4Y2EWK9_ARAVE|nr:hypothetical protein AVEN_71552-1 [Araneus ventricosus]
MRRTTREQASLCSNLRRTLAGAHLTLNVRFNAHEASIQTGSSNEIMFQTRNPPIPKLGSYHQAIATFLTMQKKQKKHQPNSGLEG